MRSLWSVPVLTGYEPRIGGVADQAHRLARDPQTTLHLGTDPGVVEVPAERVRDEVVVLVLSVVADGFPQEALADTKPDPVHRSPPVSALHDGDNPQVPVHGDDRPGGDLRGGLSAQLGALANSCRWGCLPR